MDFKIEITCLNCDCKFELRPAEFHHRESMFCPNCNQQFPDNIYQHLKTGIIELSDVPEYVSENESCPLSKDLFKINVKEYSTFDKVFPAE